MDSARSDEMSQTLVVTEIERLETQLTQRLGRQVYDLRLARREEGLVLCGSARTYYAKQLAQEAFFRATSLPLVANEIKVA